MPKVNQGLKRKRKRKPTNSVPHGAYSKGGASKEYLEMLREAAEVRVRKRERKKGKKNVSSPRNK